MIEFKSEYSEGAGFSLSSRLGSALTKGQRQGFKA